MDASPQRLEGLRRGALYFTMAAAILAGAVGLLRVVGGDDGAQWLETLDNVLVVALMAGGVLMGALYAVHRASGDRRT